MLVTSLSNSLDLAQLSDNSSDLSPGELACVRAAMEAGLLEFTVPTTDLDQGRRQWAVADWVGMKPGVGKGAAPVPVMFRVAYVVDNAHFEVVGPEVEWPGRTTVNVPSTVRVRASVGSTAQPPPPPPPPPPPLAGLPVRPPTAPAPPPKPVEATTPTTPVRPSLPPVPQGQGKL